MADITVTTLQDEAAETDPNTGAFTGTLATEAADGDGLALREAVQLGQNGDRILFEESLNGTIRLESSLATIRIETNITIDGDNRITISGDSSGDDIVVNGITNVAATRVSGYLNDNVKVFFLNNSATDVVLEGLTITGGRDTSGFGGAIDAYVSGLTVRGSTIAGNISYNGHGGGGIYSAGDLTIEGSTFFGNVARYGNNTRIGEGGGAIFSTGGSLTVSNSTFVGNSAVDGTNGAASGGAIFANSDVDLTNVTITGNLAEDAGGGIFSTTNAFQGLSVVNSIVLGNESDSGNDNEISFTGYGSQTIANSLYSGDIASSVFATTEVINGRRAGVLADNGGNVLTVALRETTANPAIDTGDDSQTSGSTDGRGQNRRVEIVLVNNDGTNISDLGAYEVQPTLDDNGVLQGTLLNDDITATGGQDTVFGKRGDDTINGGEDADFLVGSGGNDVLRGNNGFDTLEGRNGEDTLNGGNGRDTLDGGNNNDVLLGGVGSDVQRGGNGADRLNGEMGNDTLNGGNGSDTVDGGKQDDFILGGFGADLLRGGSGDDSLRGESGTDTLLGGSGNDTLVGGTQDDVLRGGGDNDVLLGGGNDDRLLGENNNDTLNGGDGNDTLNGGSGRDVVTGGLGKDKLTGGAGPDRFVFKSAAESGPGNANRDLITDFDPANDVIDLSAIDAQTGGGNQAFTFVGLAGFSGSAGELRYTLQGGNTVVQGDRNGDGVADFEILLNGLVNLDAGDFIL